MPRPIELNREDAELLDTVLLAYVKANPETRDHRAMWMAGELCRIWGMGTWDIRPDSGITTQEWHEWMQYSPY